MNQYHCIGVLTRDPELRQTRNDKQVVNFTVAINRSYKRGNERVQETAFLECEAWDTGASTIAKYFKKGRPIILHGSLKQDDWEDKATGQKRSKLKLRVEQFEFMPNFEKSQKKDEAAGNKSQDTGDNGPDVDGEDIPF